MTNILEMSALKVNTARYRKDLFMIISFLDYPKSMTMANSPIATVQKEPHLISLMLLSAFAAMGAILMTPAIPQVASHFHVPIGLAQMIVSSFLLGYALGQIIYGPIANRLGRKPTFLLGIAMATAGSLFSILAGPLDSFVLLIVGRFLEAIGASAGLVVCIILINEFYSPTEARRVIGLLMIAFAIVPGIAVTVGGFLTEYLHWEACLYFLLIYGLLLIVPVLRLPETLLQKDPHALHYQHLWRNYAKAFRNRRLMGYALCAGLSASGIYVFGAEGPYIGIRLLGINPAYYGLLGLIPYCGTLLGALLSARLKHWHAHRVLILGFGFELAGAVIMLLAFLSHHLTLITLLAPMLLFCMGHPCITGTSIATGVAHHTTDKGNGSAVANFVMMSMPMVCTFALGALQISAAWILPVFLVGIMLTMALNFVGVVVFGTAQQAA